MSRIKVLEVLECGGPGGTGNQVAAICRGLDPERFDVILGYAVRGGEPSAYERDAAPARGEFIPELVREISPVSDLKAFWRLYSLIRRERPDVVHAHSSKAGVLARIAAKAAGAPKIFYSPRGYSFLQQDRGPAARLLYRTIEAALARIGRTIAVSESEAALARALGARHPIVVNDPFLGTSAPRNGQPQKTHPLLVGSCGRLTYARNPDAFVLLCQRVTDSRNGAGGLWIGGGELEGGVRRHLENMNLLKKVEVTGWLEPEKARARLPSLDVFVHYSRWEGLPNAVLEAMAAGLPVVASDIPGNRDAVEDGVTGYLVKTEIELLERTLELIDKPDLRRKMGEAGRRRVSEKFTLARALSQLEAHYSA